MSLSKEFFKHQKLSEGLAFVAVCLLLSTAAFPKRMAKSIKKEANGCCDECHEHVGTENLIAAHIIHGINEKSNGRALCKHCETEYHLQNSANPQAIGFSHEVNDPIAYGHVLSLCAEKQAVLIDQHRSQWNGILTRMKKI